MNFASVISAGAKGDGVTDDTSSIQTAINLGNVVIIPPGTYVVSDQISVPSHRMIRLLPGAVLLRKSGTGQQNSATSNNANFWVNSDPVGGNSNIHIEGGVYDGNQAGQTPVDYGNTSRFCGGTAMRFQNVSNLTVRNVIFQNNISFNLQVGQVSDFHIENIRFVFSGSATHQDGVHVNGPAIHGTIRDIYSNGGNDALIALNADDAVFGKMTDGGDIQNILVENVHCPHQTFTPYQGSAIMLLNGAHNIYDVMCRNFRFLGAQAETVIDLETYPGVGANTGIIDRVVFDNFDTVSPCVNDGFCQCDLNIGSVTFTNCRWKAGAGASDAAQTYQCFFRQRAGHIENLTFDGIQIIEHNTPGNTPIVVTNATNVAVANVLLTRPSAVALSGFLMDITGTVANVTINGALVHKLAGLVNGNATGSLVTAGVNNLAG